MGRLMDDGCKPLSTYEFAVLCCMTMAGSEGISVAEVKVYLWSVCHMRVSSSSLGTVLRRMEQAAYITELSEKRPVMMYEKKKGPGAVKVYVIINPGRDGLKDFRRWVDNVWHMTGQDAVGEETA